MNQVLLIIDAQQELIEGNETVGPVFNKENLIIAINSVIAKAIEATVPIIIVRDLDVSNGKGKGFEVHEGIYIPTGAKRQDLWQTFTIW